MTDQQMHERLEAAGSRWRDEQPVAEVGDFQPLQRDRTRMGRRQVTWLLTAAAVLAAAVGIAIPLFASGGTGHAPAGNPNDLYGVRWTWSGDSVGHAGYTRMPRTFRLTTRPWLRFGKGGTVSGSDGCNALSGPISLAGHSIDFRKVAVTSKACGGATGKISSGVDHVLFGAVSWRIVCNELMITGHAGEVDFENPDRTLVDVACLRRWSNKHAVK